MSLPTAYQTLKELFPQVDDRLLKATAREHGDDVEIAVDFIVNEVLPFMTSDRTAADSEMSSCISTVVNSMGGSFSSENQGLKFKPGSHENSPNLATASRFPRSSTDVAEDSSLNLGLIAFEHCAGTDTASQCVKPSTVEKETIPDSCQNVLEPFHEERFGLVESHVPSERNSNPSSMKNEESSEQNLRNDPDCTTADYQISIRSIEESLLTTAAGHSSQIVNADFLEDLINEAKKNKAILLKTMESIAVLMKEADIYEKEAEDAKVEASLAGSEAMKKVEDFKKMLARAREANDMQAGEVFGEKSILATEARELQSRLLHLAEERDKYLSIIDEMNRDLQARIATASAVKAEAEQEKLKKEEFASIALAEQELIMEKVVAESKKLKEQAEENSKLREFLIDRGRIVDVLQGELSVVCEDVKLLKERSDKGLSVGSSSFLASKLGADVRHILSALNLSIESQTASSEGRDVASINSSLAESLTINEAANPDSATGDKWEETSPKIVYKEMVGQREARDETSPKIVYKEMIGQREAWDEPWELLKGDGDLLVEVVEQ